MWVLPTSHNDPDSKWSDDANAYDDDTGTGALSLSGLTWFLELILASPINCDKIRFWSGAATTVDIDVYYDGTWHDVYQGTPVGSQWEEKSIPTGTKIVSKARFATLGSGEGRRLYEFDFNAIQGFVG